MPVTARAALDRLDAFHLSVQPDPAAGSLRALRPHRGGLPVGLQIVGQLHDDMTVLKAARAYEAAQPFPMPKV